MKSAITIRLLWKEMCVQGPFWVACAVMCWVCQLAVVLWPDDWLLSLGHSHRTVWLFFVVVVITGLYAAGSAAVSFALEEEQGTIGLLRALPTTSRRIFLTKAVWGLSSTLLFGGLLWLATSLWGHGWPTPAQYHGLFAVGGWIVLQISLWTTLLSLRSDKTLVVVCMGIVAALGALWLVYIAMLIATTLVMHTLSDDAADRLSATAVIAANLLVLAGLTWLILRSGDGWLERSKRNEPRQSQSGWDVIGDVVTLSDGLFRPHRGRFVWLVWQHFRQSWRMFALFSPWFLLAGLHLAHNFTAVEWAGGDWCIACLCFPFLAASFVFQGDQSREGFRFFAARGISPRGVWWSRQAVWAAFHFAIGLLTLGILYAVWLSQPRFSLDSGPEWGHAAILANFFIAGVVTYACGLLASQLLRSTLLAAVAGPILLILLVLWGLLMRVFGLSSWWSVLPIAGGMIVATRIRTDAWMCERRSWRRRLPWLAAVAVPTFAILLAIPWARLNQVAPCPDPGFSPSRFEAEMLQGENGRRLTALVQTMRASTVGDFFVFEEARDGSRRIETGLDVRRVMAELPSAMGDVRTPPLGVVIPPSVSQANPDLDKRLSHASQWFVEEGRRLQREGDLQGALDRYLLAAQATPRGAADWRFFPRLHDWVMDEAQTPDDLRNAIELLESWSPVEHGAQAYLMKKYMQCVRRIESGKPRFRGEEKLSWLRRLLLTFSPWERERAERWLNRTTRDNLVLIGEYCRRLERNEADPLSEQQRLGVPLKGYGGVSDPGLALILMGEEWEFSDTWQLQWLRKKEESRRAALVRCALRAYQLEHDGELPAHWGDLVGPYLTEMPQLQASERYAIGREFVPPQPEDGGVGQPGRGL